MEEWKQMRALGVVSAERVGIRDVEFLESDSGIQKEVCTVVASHTVWDEGHVGKFVSRQALSDMCVIRVIKTGFFREAVLFIYALIEIGVDLWTKRHYYEK